MLSKALSEPRSGSGLKYHSDAVTLVNVKASRRPASRGARSTVC